MTRSFSSTNPEPRTLRFDRAGNPCRTLRNSDKAVCDGSLRFPIAVGNKHDYKELPFPNGNGHSSATCQVKGEEKVTVPAGVFDTVRIECAGFWTQVFDGSFRGRQTETLWYAPAISRLVKWQFFNFRGDNSPFTKNQHELVEFIPAK